MWGSSIPQLVNKTASKAEKRKRQLLISEEDHHGNNGFVPGVQGMDDLAILSIISLKAFLVPP
jgi:hypothetical protein